MSRGIGDGAQSVTLLEVVQRASRTQGSMTGMRTLASGTTSSDYDRYKLVAPEINNESKLSRPTDCRYSRPWLSPSH